MLPTDWMYGGWPESGEIDIMEHVGYDPGRVHGSIHTGSYNHKINTQRGGSKLLDKISSKFYVYAIEWYEDRIDFLIDDSKYFSFQNDGKNDFNTWPLHAALHKSIHFRGFCLNIAQRIVRYLQRHTEVGHPLYAVVITVCCREMLPLQNLML